MDVKVNELCIVIWDDKPGQRNWYVGMCRSKDEETYEIEHMERVRAIPWWRLWPEFENFSLLNDHSSYNKQAINHFVVDVRSTLGGQSTATPKKLSSVKVKHSVHVTPGYVCDFARKWVLPLNRYKAQFLWSVIEFCVNINIFDGRHIAKHFTILNMEIHFAPVILSILL